MVRELARLTGESKTEAVRQTVGERLQRERQQNADAADEAVRRLREVSKRGAKNKLPEATSDRSFLYDDGGAPA